MACKPRRCFGDRGVNGYAWENGGWFYLPAGPNKIELYDNTNSLVVATGLLLTTDTSFIPAGIGRRPKYRS